MIAYIHFRPHRVKLDKFARCMCVGNKLASRTYVMLWVVVIALCLVIVVS